MLKKNIQYILAKKGYKIVKTGSSNPYADMEPRFIEYFEKCKNYTRTSIERMYSVYKSVEYVVKNNLEGDMVECGTWRGGSAMMMAYSLMEFNDLNRNIILYDTYEGMSEPGNNDKTSSNEDAAALLKAGEHEKENSVWCLASMEDVRKNLINTGYPEKNMYFIKGKVEDTIPEQSPKNISLLRLDTDWYESTYHELIHLYPLLISKGVLIIDDYGHWLGARKATDQYFEESKTAVLLNRIDYTGRLCIKP